MSVAAGGHFLPVVSDHLLGAGDLFPGRQQPFAIKKRPPVELAGGQLNVIGFQLNAQLDNFIELVDVVPVENEVEHHRVVARFHGFGHGQLLLEGFLLPASAALSTSSLAWKLIWIWSSPASLKASSLLSVSPIPEVIRLV